MKAGLARRASKFLLESGMWPGGRPRRSDHPANFYFPAVAKAASVLRFAETFSAASFTQSALSRITIPHGLLRIRPGASLNDDLSSATVPS
jgi:hypothetical protein